MKKISVVLFVCGLVFASPAFAQEEGGWNKRSFAFGGGGGFTASYSDSTFFHVGGGFETISPVGVGFVVDFGYQGFTGNHRVFGVVSVSPALVYEIPLRGKVRPYARAGLGIIANGSGSEGLWNIGGGVNYWFRERAGIKVEVRDSFSGTYLDNGMLEVLVGVMYHF
ncbi:MAG: hypothetical protein PVJ49_17075 [Acidobacteriota bacterium]|jgi:hypothetical protein